MPRERVISTMSDKNGEFRLDNVPAAELSLFVEHSDWPLTIDGPFQVLARQASRREVRMHGTAVIAGTLLGLDKKPVAGAKLDLSVLQVRGKDSRTRWEAKSDKEGKFRFAKGLASGSYLLKLSINEVQLRNVIMLRRITVKTATEHEIILAPHGDAEINVMLRSAVALPSSYFSLQRETPQGKVDDSFPRKYIRLEKGRATIRGLAPGLYRLKVNLDEFGRGNALVPVSKGENKHVEIALQR